jgi:exopolysaccharide biosynthesis polyprenyl glycosylphosphotransferase
MLSRQRKVQTRLHQVMDAALFGVAFWLAHWLRSLPAFDRGNQIQDFSYYSWLLLLIVPLTPPLLELGGYYSRPLLFSRRDTVWQLSKASFWVALLAITASFFKEVEGARNVARGVLALFPPVAIMLGLAKEELFRRWTLARFGSKASRRRVILMGAFSNGRFSDDTERFEKRLTAGSLGDMEIISRLDINETSPNQLAETLHETSANAVIVSPRQALFGTIEQAIQVCELEGVEVWLLADFFQTRLSRASTDELQGHPVLVFRTGPEASWQALAKTALDFVGSFLLLVVLGPLVMLPMALLVRLTSKGPVLFRQQRAGLNGQPFTMLKFRTMVSNAEQLKQELAALNEMSGPVFKVTNDPRITPIGRFLRKWSIDELPQLINVLRGEMSLVGPRPLPVDEVRRFDDPAHRRRLSVKPGLTCLWQISGRNQVSDFKEWVRLDLEYIDNWSLWLDIKILLRTVPAVFAATGAK